MASICRLSHVAQNKKKALKKKDNVNYPRELGEIVEGEGPWPTAPVLSRMSELTLLKFWESLLWSGMSSLESIP